MDKYEKVQISRVMRVFISSSTKEMELYRNNAIQAIRDCGMQHTNFNDPAGSGVSHRDQTIFEMNRDTICQADVFLGLYGFGKVWRPATHPGLTDAHPELLEAPDKLIMEYEYEWARDADILMLPFVCTDKTTGIPYIEPDDRMHRFRLKLMARNVGWLTTPEAFYDQLVAKLHAIEPRVFLSYSRANEEYVSELQLRLRHADIYAWRDKTNIPGSSDWAKVLETALKELDTMLVVVSPDSAKSKWVEKECKEFRAMGKPVFPYIGEMASKDDLPDYLKSLEYIDGTNTNGFTKLVKHLRAALEGQDRS